jgi:hypothetical protein
VRDVEDLRGRAGDGRCRSCRALGREERVALEPARREQTGRFGERARAETDQPLAVDPGEIGTFYGRAPAVGFSSDCTGSGSPLDMPDSAFESARR